MMGGSRQATNGSGEGAWRKPQSQLPASRLQQPAPSLLPGPHPRYLAHKAVGCGIRRGAPIRPFEPAFPLAVLALEEAGGDKSGIRGALSQPLPCRAGATAKPGKYHSLISTAPHILPEMVQPEGVGGPRPQLWGGGQCERALGKCPQKPPKLSQRGGDGGGEEWLEAH